MIIYKLISEDVKKDIVQYNSISLSRPLLKFGPPEGTVLEFFRDIAKLVEECDNYLNVLPTNDILAKLKKWYEGYYFSLNDDSYEMCDVYTDLQIIMTVYFQTYCGYFTCQNLFDEKILEKYISDNYDFVKKFNKKYILKVDIDINEQSVEAAEWELKKTGKEYKPPKYTFFESENPKPFNNNIIAYINAHRVEYMPDNYSFCDLFEIFNSFGKRRMSAFFKYLDGDYSSQQEMRIITYIPSSCYNSMITACNNLFHSQVDEPLEIKLFKYAVSVYIYAKNNFPDFIYLDVKKRFEIKPIDCYSKLSNKD